MKVTLKYVSSCAAIMLLLSCPAAAQDVFINAPTYSGSYNIGGRALTTDSYGWVHGIDVSGEWLEYDLALLVFGTYASRIVVKGTMGVEYSIRMEITGDVSHSIQVVDFDFTGAGFVG
jgi:hypothetical protein